MFYHPVSVREAIEKVNATWFLPAIQRPYDWGERNKKEEFIFKLFDSIFREYPIGTMIIWETKKSIPYRNFLEDYNSEKLSKIVDQRLWERDKLLVYDGQQRLQSLYSCLNYTFHNKVLCYDLLFALDPNELDKNGFKFFTKNETLEPGYIGMNELYSCNPKQQAEFEEIIIDRLHQSKPDLNKEEELLAKKNLKQLWKLFVDEDVKLLSYYPLKLEMEQKEVLEIFVRINKTGMMLTSSEILFSHLKNQQFDFEEQIWDVNLEIKNQTHGFSYGPDSILQVLNVLVKQTIRIDPERVKEKDYTEFISSLNKLKSPLKSFFYDFLYREFLFTHEKMINLKPALIPLIVYFYWMHSDAQKKFKDFSAVSIANMKKYLIFSQLLDWGLQNYVDNFCRIIKEECEQKPNCDFPFARILDYVENATKRRKTTLAEDDFVYAWFVLKIITPNRPFSFVKDPDERFNPEIDHIFPWSPEVSPPSPDEYYAWTVTIWNFQPVKGEINAVKLNVLPKDFFTKYPQYLKDYDFLPTNDLADKIWSMENASEFIQTRKHKIITWLKQYYDIDVEVPEHAYYDPSDDSFHLTKGTITERLRAYNPVEIVTNLKSKGIAPDDQIITGWTDVHQRLYEKSSSGT